MIKMPITYTDFEGGSHTEDFYFNLTLTELTKMELGTSGGYQRSIRRIVNAENIPEITKEFDAIILAAYGEKSPDGKRFVKLAPDGHRLADDFMQSAAYDELFMKLMTDPDEAAKFVNGIVPREVAEKAESMKDDPNILELKERLNQ